MGYALGLSIYCPKAPLPQSMAYPTYVNTLMSFSRYVCFVSE